MKLYDIISNLKFIGIKNYKEIDIDSLTIDSKEKIQSGIYFCLKGSRVDGHNYAEESISNGAVCLVVEKFLDIPTTQILVEDSRVAMSYVASVFYETYKSKMKFIGVTGTNGKTTTTFVMREILMKLGKKVGLIGTEGIYINSLVLPANLTTPDPIVLHKTIKDMENNNCEYCIMEVSAHSIALNKIDNIYYDVVGLTNITKDHLDFFLNMNSYIDCKASLFDCKHAKMGIINTDAKHGREIAKKSNITIEKMGRLDTDFKLEEIYMGVKESKFKFSYRDIEYAVKTNLLGDYNIYNILMAISCLTNVGIDIKDVVSSINSIDFVVPGRFNMLDTNTTFNVIVDYAHTPDGIKNVLTAIKSLPISRIITVFGCGGNRDKTKRNEMGEIASNMSDLVVVTSDNPRDENPEMIIDDIMFNNNSKNITRITDRRLAIEYALSIADENDVVAILGKGAENYQEIKGIKVHFSDYEVVDDYLKYNNVKGELEA